MEDFSILEERTIVLVGKTGNGKSATGNSIIGAEVFDSMSSFGGVTTTCQMHKAVVDNAQIINVIDTPGLCDATVDPVVIRNEIAECVKMSRGGIHAVVIVVSLGCRFSQEEVCVIESLKKFFGDKIGDYMIIVFTHGDALRNVSLHDLLCGSPEHLKKVLEMCEDRYMVFDNHTSDEFKKSEQRKELLRLVATVVRNNGGEAFTNDLFVDFPDAAGNGKEFNNANEKLLEKIESKLQETTARMEKQLADELAARKESEAEISRLNAQLMSQIELEKNLKEELKEKEMKEMEWKQLAAKKESEAEISLLSAQLTLMETEKKLKEKLEAELEEAKQETKKKMKEMERSLKEANEKRHEEVRRLEAAINGKPNCAVM